MKRSRGYVHGYTDRESARLVDQAATLTELLHSDTIYPPGSAVLEAGCGVGAQTVILAKNSPGARITSLDLSPDSLARAKERADAAGVRNVTFRQGDVYRLPFPPESFDHVFVCFVLEHLKEPQRALEALRGVLKAGGTITVIEGDHGSAFFHPDSAEARRAIECLSEIQAAMGGDARIGRRLYPLLRDAGFGEPCVSPRLVYADPGRPALVEGFTKHTFTAMVEGVRGEALARGLVDEKTWEKGIADLYRAAGPGGTFVYVFFKAVASK